MLRDQQHPKRAYATKVITWSLLASIGLSTGPGSSPLLANTPSRAPASYDHVVTWSDMSDLDLRKALRSQYGSNGNLMDSNISESTLEIVLQDADNRVQPEFKIPSHLQASVRFWLKIYTQHTTQHSVIFDSRHPDIVYDVLDFRELSKTARNAIVYEIVSRNRVKKALATYRKALRRLATGAKPKTREELKVAEAFKSLKALGHKHSYRELAENVRAQTGQRDNVMKGLLAAEAFFPRMDSVFTELGLPTQLTRLAMVESSFDLRAHSYAGAVGIWQFMPNVGDKFLRIDHANRLDERLSPLKSTVAAGKLLKENFRMFKSWPLAITSYNHGLRGLPRAGRKIAVANSDFSALAPLFKGCNKKSPLGWAGRNYYAEFLAVLHAEQYRQVFYGDPPVSQIRAVSFKLAPTGQTGLAVAMANNVSINEFKLLNPDIKDLHKKLPSHFFVAIPAESDDLAALLTSPHRRRVRALSSL